jgi:hypothetical protein
LQGTLVVVERVSNLIHDKVRMSEEAVDPVVEVDTDIILVFLQA